MAEFCKQCAEIFGFENDFKGMTSPEDWSQGKAAVVLCEECGPTQVDPEGNCVTDCRLRHRKELTKMGEGKEMEMDERCKEPTFKDACFALRDSLKHAEGIALTLGELAGVCPFEEPGPCVVTEILYQERRSEMIANVKLAYRHLEDARMRIGKAIQAFDGGESCYPK